MLLYKRLLVASLCWLFWLVSASVARAEDAPKELVHCKAGDAIDMPCMTKSRGHFEKYVIEAQADYGDKQTIALALDYYYRRSGEPPTQQSRTVITKLAAFNHSVEIYNRLYEVRSTHREYEREAAIKIKEYLVGLDAVLYAPDIKYLEKVIKPKNGPGFWSQVGTGLLEGAVGALAPSSAPPSNPSPEPPDPE